MRVFVIGDTESIWIKEFIENVLIPEGYIVNMQKKIGVKERFGEFYKQNNISFIAPYKVSPFIMKMLPRIRVWISRYKRLRALEKTDKYDCVIQIFVTPFDMKCAQTIVSRNGKIYSLFIGSDILRANHRTINLLNKSLCHSNVSIVCESLNVLNACKRKLDKQLHFDFARFGITKLDTIDNLRSKKKDAKNLLGLSITKTTVCIGYNGSTAQQHLKVLDELLELDDKIKEKLLLLLPLTYGLEKSYMLKIKKKLREVNIDYKIFEKYCNDTEMTHIWLATDIFINSQTTDALSTSVIECLYSGAVLLNAKWLSYPEFSMWDIKCEIFDTFQQIPNIILRYLNGEIVYDNSNLRKIKTATSWHTCRITWSNLLK